MSDELRDLATMIATASIGDGDRVLDILEKVCELLADLEHRVRRVESGLVEDGRL